MTNVTSAVSPKQIESECRRRRTFAIISHPDAGKTTLTEKLLLFGGAIHEAGAVKSNRAKAATSDWMELEKQRGISITSTCLQFEYEGHCLNLLDTPGHQDFSEDTYRTLAAADNAVMLIDAAKGLEPQTRKLLAVCRTRKLPLFTFVNKLDRPSREPLELLDEIEKEFSLPTFAVNWPIGTGDKFMGVVNRLTKDVFLFERTVGGRTIGKVTRYDLESPALKELIPADSYKELMDELEMLDGAGQEFDQDKILSGDLTPVFFGSAMNNFGVELFLQAFLKMGAEPAAFPSNQGKVEPTEPEFSGFVFKLQANMDPRHRDRIAFVRVCSGVFEKDMTVYNSRTGASLLLSQPKKLFGRDRASIDTAFAGDIIGLSNPGSFAIGDTIALDKQLRFPAIPSFAAELFAILENKEPSKHKHFHKGILALQEEGAIQILWLTEHDTRFPILAAVGQLQFEVVQFRMQSEYNVQTNLRQLEIKHTLWVEGGWAVLNAAHRDRGNFMVATDRDDNPVLLFKQNWDLTAFKERNPKVVLTPVSPGSEQVQR